MKINNSSFFQYKFYEYYNILYICQDLYNYVEFNFQPFLSLSPYSSNITYNQELNTIFQIAENNGYNKEIIKNLVLKIKGQVNDTIKEKCSGQIHVYRKCVV